MKIYFLPPAWEYKICHPDYDWKVFKYLKTALILLSLKLNIFRLNIFWYFCFKILSRFIIYIKCYLAMALSFKDYKTVKHYPVWSPWPFWGFYLKRYCQAFTFLSKMKNIRKYIKYYSFLVTKRVTIVMSYRWMLRIWVFLQKINLF